MRLCLVSYMLQLDGQIPIGLLTLAEIARQEGVDDIRVLDLPMRREEAEFVRSIRDCDVVGFSSICSTYNQTVRLCRRLKEINPTVLLLLGGPQASLTAQASLAAFPFVDAIFQGEAETSWREFIRQSQRGTVRWQEIPGIAWRNGADVHLNCPAPLIEDLDTLPEPALDLYAFSRCASVTPIEIGRGCPFACTFCTASPFFRRRFRLKPIARILQEMDAIFERYGSRHFYFVQDSFSVKRQFVEEICAALKNHHRSYTWHCSARTDQISDQVATTMKEAGCRGVYFGLESGSQRMQKVINKKLDVKQAVEVIQRTAKLGLEVTTSMIIGFPDEKPEDLRDSLRVMLDLKGAGHALVQVHVLAPLPGSKMSEEGHTLHYDGMPSDFSDTAHVLDAEDETLIMGHPEIFSNFWYYVNPWISRQRLLFLAHWLCLASLYFPNALRLTARHAREALVDRLLDGTIPAQFQPDQIDVADTVKLIGEGLMEVVAARAYEPLDYAMQYDLAHSAAELAIAPGLIVLQLPETLGPQPRRTVIAELESGAPLAPYVFQKPDRAVEVFRVSPEVAASLVPETPSRADLDALSETSFDDICAACGECCFEAGGLLCGSDEWPTICKHLVANGGPELVARPLADSGLVVVDEWREVAQRWGSKGKTAVRRACPALEFRDQRWRCSIENVKPAGCVAYPLTLVLREQSAAGAQWCISLELNGRTPRQSCPLDRALRRSPRLLQRFREDVQRRQGNRHGAFMLAAYNRTKQLETATPMHGELP